MVIHGAEVGTPATTLIEEAASALSDLEREGEQLARALNELHAKQDAFEKNVRSCKRTLVSLPPGDQAVVDLRKRHSVVSRLTPSPGGFFVELFLGSVNVRFMRKSERMSFKADYERLKQRLAPVFAAICVLCLYFRENRWLHVMFQLTLTTYYVALAIRENILRINGSNIKPWWILHHYITMVSGVLLLTWPNNPSYAEFRTGLHYYGLYNSILQIFQTRYQMARLYTLRSLGMAGEMDVANSDSTQIHWSESMKLLLPLIFLGLLLQAGQAVSLLRIYASHPHELQILLLGILFLVLFIGNTMTTSIVMVEKRSVPAGGPPRPRGPAAVPIPSAASGSARPSLRSRPVPARSSDQNASASARPPTIPTPRASVPSAKEAVGESDSVQKEGGMEGDVATEAPSQ